MSVCSSAPPNGPRRLCCTTAFAKSESEKRRKGILHQRRQNKAFNGTQTAKQYHEKGHKTKTSATLMPWGRSFYFPFQSTIVPIFLLRNALLRCPSCPVAIINPQERHRGYGRRVLNPRYIHVAIHSLRTLREQLDRAHDTLFRRLPFEIQLRPIP